MRVMPIFWAMSPVRMMASLELHQRGYRLRRRIDDVEHALVSPDLELLARLLVDMRRAQDGELLDLGRQRNRTAHARPCALGRADDLAGRLVEHAMIVRPEADPDILAVHFYYRPLEAPAPYLMILATTPA